MTGYEPRVPDAEWIRSQFRALAGQIEDVRRRSVGASATGAAVGTIDRATGRGALRVRLDGSNEVVTVTLWPVGYSPKNGDRVVVIRHGGAWTIATEYPQFQAAYPLLAPLTLEAPFTLWGGWRDAAYSVEGNVVVLQGLVGTNGAIPAGTLITRLLPEHAPSARVLIATNLSGNTVFLRVDTDGSVRVHNAITGTSNQYINLGSVRFWITGGTALLSTQYANGWGPRPEDGWGWRTPSYFIQDGQVMFSGLVSGGSTASDNTLIHGLGGSNVGARATGSRQAHGHGYTELVASVVGSNLDAPSTPTGLLYKSASGTPAFLGLDGILYPVAGSPSWTDLALTSPWTNRDVTRFPPFGTRKTPGGLVLIRGLIQGGAVNGIIGTLPVGSRPTGLVMARAQITAAGGIAWLQISADGIVRLGNGAPGSNALSVDGVAFWAEQ